MKESNYILIGKYLSGSATGKETDEFQEWLKKDPQNQLVFQEAEKLWKASLSLKKTEEHDAELAWDDFKLKAKAQKERKDSDFFYLRVAAAITLFIFIGALVKFFVFNSNEEKNVAVKQETPVIKKVEDTVAVIQTPVKDTTPLKTLASVSKKINFINTGDTAIVFLLPDSSKVYLNKKSKISYASTFGAKDRKINLNGEAYFEIHPNKAQFMVVCKKAIIKDIGTSFNVKGLETDSLLEINVITGVVEITTEKNKTMEPLILKAGNNSLYNPSNSRHNKIKHKKNLKWWKSKGIKNRIKEFLERLKHKNHS